MINPKSTDTISRYKEKKSEQKQGTRDGTQR